MTNRRDIRKLQDIPNIGPAMARDLALLNIHGPAELIGKDPYAMHAELCRITGVRHDPCVMDVFIAAVRFMEGEPARKWWYYTAERKEKLSSR
jgi:hypothetical protein